MQKIAISGSALHFDPTGIGSYFVLKSIFCILYIIIELHVSKASHFRKETVISWEKKSLYAIEKMAISGSALQFDQTCGHRLVFSNFVVK